ncbi:hypothetical protein M408DRAFT_333802 [Serendipita vermifera MAFF 305830]|uniref:DH domain-containing protein n=1 Tax=Serendipita vermifera MAFF 305830 TaxID=933852 RepID=A0A0C2WTE7_SERVB|nr:hypothetical protein M408DRAFT_333802 [Serendipita vermifera MAFF 305830]
MGDSADKGLPHTAFDIISEEHKYLKEFLDLVSKKLDADKRYLKELERVGRGRGSRKPDPKPQWAKSSIWSLISPLLSYFEDEKRHLRQSIKELTPIIEKLNHAPFPASI